MPPEEIDYESLKNRWQREVTSGPRRLTRLDPTFYQRVEAYLRKLEEDYQRENAIDPASGKATLLRDELLNLRRIVEDLYDQRERKIALLALAAARGSDPDRVLMTPGERDLFESVSRALKEGRRQILRRGDRDLREVPKAAPLPETEERVPEAGLASFDEDAPEPEPVPEAPEPSVARDTPGTAEVPPPPGLDLDAPDDEEAPADEEALPATHSGRVLVRMLEEVPPFTASDMRTYALHGEDVAALPPDAARALVDRGKAVLVAGEGG